jgi:hypothetical protein
MTVTYNWVITHLSTVSSDNYSDVITGATWELFGTDGTNTTSLTGVTPFALPNNSFIDYADLTEEQIISWVEASLSELRLNEVKGVIATTLSQLSYQPKPLPWNLPKPKKAAAKNVV